MDGPTPRHHRLEAVRADGRGDARRVGGDHDAAEAGLGGALGHMDDHRPAGDVGQRLARQAGGGHAGRDEEQGGHQAASGRERGPGKVAKRLTGRRPYRCCNGIAKDLVSARFDAAAAGDGDTAAASGPSDPPDEGSRWRNGFFRSQQAARRVARNRFRRLLGRPGLATAIFCLARPGKARLRHRGRRSPAEGGQSGRRRPPSPSRSPTLLAKADAEAGEAIFKKCQACHTGEKGGPNKVGPNLWGIVDRPVAAHEGFAYSAGMKEFSKGGTEKWDYDNINDFITSPKAYREGHGDGLRRPAEGRGPRQRHRLSAHAGGHSRAAAGTGAAADRQRRPPSRPRPRRPSRPSRRAGQQRRCSGGAGPITNL